MRSEKAGFWAATMQTTNGRDDAFYLWMMLTEAYLQGLQLITVFIKTGQTWASKKFKGHS